MISPRMTNAALRNLAALQKIIDDRINLTALPTDVLKFRDQSSGVQARKFRVVPNQFLRVGSSASNSGDGSNQAGP
jgi:hypothetical protein